MRLEINLFFKNNKRPVTVNHFPGILGCFSKVKKSMKM